MDVPLKGKVCFAMEALSDCAPLNPPKPHKKEIVATIYLVSDIPAIYDGGWFSLVLVQYVLAFLVRIRFSSIRPR